MGATAAVKECNGAAPGAWNTVTAAKFCTSDAYNPATTFPIPIPAAGLRYSYWKSHSLTFTGTWTSLTNVKVYTDTTGFGTGIVVALGTPQLGTTDYHQATGTEGTTGDEFVAGHPHVDGSVDFFGYGSASPYTVDAGPLSGTPAYSNMVILQMVVSSAASPGELTPETITFQYDEV